MQKKYIKYGLLSLIISVFAVGMVFFYRRLPNNTPNITLKTLVQGMTDLNIVRPENGDSGQPGAKIVAQDGTLYIERIALEGTIEDSTALVEKFIQLRSDENVHAVLFTIDSGGGSVASSEILHHELLRLAQAKPVVVFVENECCSGAYWIASAASYIMAPRTADIGSIGVRRTLTKNKIKKFKDNKQSDEREIEIMFTGDYKVFEDPNAPAMTDEQRELIQRDLNYRYDVFCCDVADARGLDITKHKEWANGKVFCAQEALDEYCLIDAIGYPAEAQIVTQDLAREHCGLQADAQFSEVWYSSNKKA